MKQCCYYSNLLILFVLMSILFSENYINEVEGRAHYHKKKGGIISAPSSPAYAPDPNVPPPLVPSDPYSSPTQNGPCIFDVTSFGAVGDGNTDDTAAFQATWKAACAVESSVILLPSKGKFMITSSIFNGPCKPGLVMQVTLSFKFFIIINNAVIINVLISSI